MFYYTVRLLVFIVIIQIYYLISTLINTCTWLISYPNEKSKEGVIFNNLIMQHVCDVTIGLEVASTILLLVSFCILLSNIFLSFILTFFADIRHVDLEWIGSMFVRMEFFSEKKILRKVGSFAVVKFQTIISLAVPFSQFNCSNQLILIFHSCFKMIIVV